MDRRWGSFLRKIWTDSLPRCQTLGELKVRTQSVLQRDKQREKHAERASAGHFAAFQEADAAKYRATGSGKNFRQEPENIEALSIGRSGIAQVEDKRDQQDRRTNGER